MLPNKPTTNEVLDFKVTLSGGDMGQSCVYQNGQFSSDVIPGGSSDTGCTVSITTHVLFSNTTDFVLSSPQGQVL